MKTIKPHLQREFAIEVVRQLCGQGFQAYWAGGCVRDLLLQRIPKDYDVATSASPEQICAVFKQRKTLAMGAAFGVMTVVGPRGAGQVEVATFRHDIGYSDGRHPDRIEFSSAQEDAQRRDFTINGMFYDPLAQRVIDFVGGEADLHAGIVRAIGDAQARFTEDKLRMLRAVRFASVFNFHLEESTLAAIGSMASQITVVSAERIADEVRSVLVHAMRAKAVELWLLTGLLRAILPEVAGITTSTAGLPTPEWTKTVALLEALDRPTFALALAVLLSQVDVAEIAEAIGQRWRLARKEIDEAAWLLTHRSALEGAKLKPWSQVQPLLVAPWADDLVQFHALHAQLGSTTLTDVEFCRQRLHLPMAELDPPPLVTGDDLITVGIPRGPVFSQLLQAARDAQLDGQVHNHAAALELVLQRWKTI